MYSCPGLNKSRNWVHGSFSGQQAGPGVVYLQWLVGPFADLEAAEDPISLDVEMTSVDHLQQV